MAKLKCIACGQENKVGEESCARCLSSLNLRLCSACEAINDHTAERCHGCGAEFGDEVATAPRAQEPAPAAELPGAERVMAEAPKVAATVEVVDEPAPSRSLPARRYINPVPARSRVAQAAVIWTVAIGLGVGAAYAYHRYQVSGWPSVSGFMSASITAAPAPVAATPAQAPKASADGKPPVKAAAASPLSAKPPAPSPAAGPTAEPKVRQATSAPEPKRAAAPVTHTRAGSAALDTPAPASPAATAPTAPAVAPPAPAVAPAASAARSMVQRPRVTHTKAPEPGEATAVAVSAPATLTQPPIEKPMNPNPSACAPALAALGLCVSK